MKNSQKENQEIAPIPRINPNEPSPQTNPVLPGGPEITRIEPARVTPEISPDIKS